MALKVRIKIWEKRRKKKVLEWNGKRQRNNRKHTKREVKVRKDIKKRIESGIEKNSSCQKSNVHRNGKEIKKLINDLRIKA